MPIPPDRITRRTVRVRHGTEGPRIDPYGVQTITVRVNEIEYVIRQGGLSGTAVSVETPHGRTATVPDWDGNPQTAGSDDDYKEKVFAQMTGATVGQWLKWRDVVEYRRGY